MKSREPIHYIWQNYDLDLEDWKEGLLENREINGLPTDVDDDTLREEMYELNNSYLDDERMNLDIPTEGRIIEIADVGLWDGRRMGYNLLDEHNIKACLNFKRDCEYAEWWVDEADDLRSKQTHHDSYHKILYREIRPNMSSDQIDNFCWKLYRGEATPKDITKYTRAIGKQVRNVYGW